MGDPRDALLAACEEQGWVLSVRRRRIGRGRVVSVTDPLARPPRVLARGRGPTLDDAADACLASLVRAGHALRPAAS
jgi:hypothetical protein